MQNIDILLKKNKYIDLKLDFELYLRDEKKHSLKIFLEKVLTFHKIPIMIDLRSKWATTKLCYEKLNG